jgi:glycosyltransferase involved in cell wall biosynthesis
MNIYIDGRWDGNTGIGRVYREVISRKPNNIEISILKSDLKLGHPLSPIYLRNKIKVSSGDVFYSPSFMPPIKSPIPFVITIHDLNHLYYYSKFHKFYLKYIIGYLASKAKKIITVSQFTKHEIVEKLKIDCNKVEVIYNGIDSSFTLNNESYLLERPYFLYIGNKRKYKNIIRMLRAFAHAEIPNEYMLAISGNTNPELDNEIKLLGIANRIKFLGTINNADLPKIYKGAYALLFVSLMEGFGLPILEAMASGTPVITSNISSLPEIAGNAALFVDPFAVRDISNAIERLVKDVDLSNTLIGLGYERSKKFNWNETAKQTWDIILK